MMNMLFFLMLLETQLSTQKNNMFIIESLVEDLKVWLPYIWTGNLMMICVKLELVLEVCVLDMLYQPVFSPVNFFNWNRILHSIEPFVENIMLLVVFLAVMISFRVAEESSFIVKVSPHLEFKITQVFSALWGVSNFSQMIK